MGGQPGKPKPIGNPPIRYEPQRPPIEEPPKPIPATARRKATPTSGRVTSKNKQNPVLPTGGQF